MTHRFRKQIPEIVAGYDWTRFSTIVDVGGGHGALLAAILTAHPGIRGHLVDFEPTATQARQVFGADRLDGRAQVTAGSFFDPLPQGARAYLLCDILHDWDDERAHQILERYVEALPPAGRVLVIEPVGGRRATTEIDLAMLAIFGGRERRIDEFRGLASAHGLVLDTVTDLTDQRCLLEFRLAAPVDHAARQKSGVPARPSARELHFRASASLRGGATVAQCGRRRDRRRPHGLRSACRSRGRVSRPGR